MTMGNGSPLKQSMIYLLVWGAAPLCAQPLPYPVRNGAFERVDGWSRPQHWGTHVMDGEHQFRYPTDAPDGARYVEITSQSGKARWYQLSVPVFAGSYRLTFRARGTPGATGHVLVAGDGVDEAMTVQPTETWQDFAMEVNVPQSGAVGLYLHSLAPGTVAYDDVALEEVRMESGPVPTDGKPLAAVIRPEDPTPAERFAAYELQRVLHAVTGVHLALAGRDEVGEGRLVYLGRAVPEALLDRAELTGEEAYAAVVTPPAPPYEGGDQGGVALAGGGDRGTLYAVYEFLRSFGCRWLTPGELGEVLPPQERLTLPPRNERFAPDYAVRGFLTSGQDFLPGGGWIPADMDAILDWALRNRFNAVWWGGGGTEDFGAHRGYGHEQTSNHSYSGLVRADTLFDAHPEWFPLVDGQRNPLHSSGRPNELCVSNPEMAEHVARQALAYFQSHPRARAFAVNHDDEPAGWCACADCRALDVRPVDWSLNGRDVLPLTDRVVAFVNRVAARVAEQYPDRLIEMYAYGSTHDPPQRAVEGSAPLSVSGRGRGRGTVHPNVLVKCCLGPSELCLRHGVFDPACARNREVVARFRTWGQRASHLGIYNYLDYYYAETPACWYSATAEQFRSLHQLGVEQVLGETSNTFTGSALWFYLLGRVLWDVDTDSEAVIDDFCTHFYGPAAEPMAEYYRTLERAVREDAERAGEENQTCNNLRRFTPEIVAAARAALERATVAAGQDDLLQARIDRAWFSLLFTETTRIAEVGPHTEEAFAHGREAFARMKEIQQQRNLCGTRASAPRLQWFYVPPLRAQSGDLLAALPLVWKFRRDPDDQGEAAGWPEAEPDGDWTDLRTDASWTDQGHAYHGVAWYTTTVAVPDFPAGRTVWLLFGAVDGDCWVWIDGQPAGKQVGDVSLMWDKPFALDVTALIRPGATQRVTVKVRKDVYAAGIWKRVELRLERGQE